MDDIALVRRLVEAPLSIDRPGDVAAGHNGGPPLDDHVPEWGANGIGNYFHWKSAVRKAYTASRDVMMFRLSKADRLGLTYEEYTLEILERGRHLQLEDVERIAAIKRARARRRSGT